MISLDTAKQHLRVDGSDEDGLIQLYVDDATHAACDYLGREVYADQEFPPRERGWSPCRLTLAALQHVSPARAGMVPALVWHRGAELSFPRASGDGPKAAAEALKAREFPPRERGWSPGIFRASAPAMVSPARAGMVPR